MIVKFKDFGLYTIDKDYLRYLHDIDDEVQFDEHNNYERKPFLGIIILINDYSYFIPLTSAKPKHLGWKTVSPTSLLIYEVVQNTQLRAKDISKPLSDTTAMKLLAALDIKKMIPVKDGLYARTDFSSVADTKYRDLLEKEFLFCQNIQDDILERAKKIYQTQKETGAVHKMYCDFSRLEDACDTYNAEG